jgi:hypothetical protein
VAEQMSLPFDINRPALEGGRTARLPSLGFMREQAMVARDAETYVAALHASIGDMGKAQDDGVTTAMKALNVQVPQAYAYANFSFMPDANNWGLMQWPGINPESLRKICRENIAPQLVIRSRVADMRRYSALSTHLWEPGWNIVMRDDKETPTAQDKRDMKACASFILNGSRDYDNDPRERDAALLTPLQYLLATFADDIHTFDGWALWTQCDRLGRPIAFANLPAGLIRLALPNQGLKGDRRYFAAMIDQTMNPVKMFTRRELLWSVMNPRTDPAAMGYGHPLPEVGVRLIQAFQSAIDLNADSFVRNGIPNGMLLLKGDFFQQEQVDALMREWTNMKRGVSKMWGMPVMSIPEEGDVEILNFMDMKGEEVRYKDHMNMMAGMYCIISNFPVRRLGLFASGQRRDNQPVPDESVEVQGVDDPGLPSHLMFLEDRFNPYLIWPTWPRIKLTFHGKDPKSDARRYEALAKVRTWREARAEADLPRLTTQASAELKLLAEIMELCPADPNMSGVFQTVAVAMLKAQLGTDDTKDDKTPGAITTGKIDPAKSQEHGHRAGVLRNSKSEAARTVQ